MTSKGLAFNQDIAMDLMYIDGRTILHLVDRGTGFGNAGVLQGAVVEDLCACFVQVSSKVYPGYHKTSPCR